MEEVRTRYPGLKPFETSDKKYFFGRDQEILEVCRLLDLDNLIVLHGPSGMGKSSMINAGILPVLEEIRNWEIPHKIVSIRFTNFDPVLAKMRRKANHLEENEELIKDPIDRFIDACSLNPAYWEESIPMPKQSFWLTVKKMLIEANKSPLRVIFVLDQFEELFTYPEERVQEFAKLLGELYQQIMPESVRKGLERKKIIDAEGISFEAKEDNGINRSVYTKKLLASLEEDLDIKILISMRSDKLSFLERFKPFLPEVMMSSFELRSFTVAQATRAIVEPAQMQGDHFTSPSWTYNKSNLDMILEFLQDKVSRRIDPSQLQIICQYIENKMIQKVEKAARMKEPFLKRIFYVKP